MAAAEEPECNGGVAGVVGCYVRLTALLETEERLQSQQCSIGTGEIMER